MLTRKIPRLYDLDPGEILEVVRDLKYYWDDYNIIYVPDAHDLYSYSFPIDPTDEHREIDLEKLAETQVALNYLFKPDEPDRPPVVLLDEYADEIKGLMDAIRRGSDEVFYSAEVISKLIQAGDLDQITEEQWAEVEPVVEKNFLFLLTVQMGIHSLGVTRMNEVYSRVLTPMFSAIRSEDREYFRNIWLRYRRSNLYHTIYEELEKHDAERNLPATPGRQRRNRNDATAIDRLIYLNTEADKRYNPSFPSFLKNKYLFLYISSAAKSQIIFDLPEIKASLPVIKGRRYPFWRNRDQLLAYVIHRNRGADTREDIRKTIAALRALDKLIKRVEEFKAVFQNKSQGCKECILDGKTPSACELLNDCLMVSATAKKIKEKREEITNWGLFKDISSYTYLRESQVRNLKLDYKVYVELFTNIIESGRFRDMALERMYLNYLWGHRANEWTLFANRIKEGYDPTRERDLRAEKDMVTGVDQHLPCKPIFKSPEYQNIIAALLRLYRQPKRADLLVDAYRQFLDLEPSRDDEEYDLLRAYLYLTFSFKDSTHESIKKILTHNLAEGASDDASRESLYVLCWSARRAGLFEEADNYALQGIEQFPEDPRFLHGRALNTYCWATRHAEECPYEIINAIADSERGLQLYKLHEAENVDLIAACYNNIAYFWALNAKLSQNSSKQEQSKMFEKAREYVEQLGTIIKKGEWDPAHPEFFHTEAFLQYESAHHYWTGQERSKREIIEMLKSARKNIKTALDIYDPPRYHDLKNDIDKLLVMVQMNLYP